MAVCSGVSSPVGLLPCRHKGPTPELLVSCVTLGVLPLCGVCACNCCPPASQLAGFGLGGEIARLCNTHLCLMKQLQECSDTRPPCSQAKDVDVRTAKRTRDRAAAAASGVSMIQNFFFNKKTPAPAPAPAVVPQANASRGARGGNDGKGSPTSSGDGGRSSPPTGSSPRPVRSRFSSVASGDAACEEERRLIEDAIPTTFAGTSWDGYLHHVDFVVALMHVGTSLMPKNLIKASWNAEATWLRLKYMMP